MRLLFSYPYLKTIAVAVYYGLDKFGGAGNLARSRLSSRLDPLESGSAARIGRPTRSGETSFPVRRPMSMRWVLALLIGICTAAESPVGVWRGESLCKGDSPSCKDEKVVYYVEAVADKADSMFVRADKIVDGKAITMGSGPWQYNAAKQTLSWETAQRAWLLTINGHQIEGTLTLPGNVVVRRMTLTKDN